MLPTPPAFLACITAVGAAVVPGNVVAAGTVVVAGTAVAAGPDGGKGPFPGDCCGLLFPWRVSTASEAEKFAGENSIKIKTASHAVVKAYL